MDRPTLAALVLGLALLVAGVACVYWPAALIVAGSALLAWGLTRDVKPTSEEPR